MLLLLSDPHLGVKRTSHTTVDSRQSLRETVFKNLMSLVTYTDDTTIIAGDLFDKCQNSEETIAQGMQISKHCDLILAGNHDLPNRDGVVSSLQLMQKAGIDAVVMNDINEANFFEFESDCGIKIIAVPHVATQQMFDELIERLLSANPADLVILHCNVDSNFAQDDASLNITSQQLKQVLEVHQYIAIGHEHHSRKIMDGRVCILGNHFPTSFGDISDKYMWGFDKKGFFEHPVWEKEKHYRVVELDADNPLTAFQLNEAVQFLELEGVIPAERGPELANFVSKMWDVNPDLLMLRNSVQYQSDFKTVTSSDGPVRINDLSETISVDVEGADFQALWAKYFNEVTA